MKNYIVIIMACAFILVNEFQNVAAAQDDNDRGFVKRFDFYWETLFSLNFLNRIATIGGIAICSCSELPNFFQLTKFNRN